MKPDERFKIGMTPQEISRTRENIMADIVTAHEEVEYCEHKLIDFNQQYPPNE